MEQQYNRKLLNWHHHNAAMQLLTITTHKRVTEVIQEGSVLSHCHKHHQDEFNVA